MVLRILRPLARIFLRTWHRARVEMAAPERAGQAIPMQGGLIVVANHVSGIDPVIVQAWFPRPIRWMMERGQMAWVARRLWRALRVIPVDPAGGTSALRESLRALSAGEVLGIFPEGQIARPPGRVQVFRPGLAGLARRTASPVAVFVLDGIPPCGNPFVSLVRPSRVRMRLVSVVAPPAAGDEARWTEAIRQSMADALHVPADTLTSE